MIHTPKHTKYLRTSWSMRSSQLRLSNVLNRLRETMHSFREGGKCNFSNNAPHSHSQQHWQNSVFSIYTCTPDIAWAKLTRELLLMRVSNVSRMVSLSWRCKRMKRRKVLRREVSVILRKNKSRYAVLAIISSTDDWQRNHKRKREKERGKQNKK